MIDLKFILKATAVVFMTIAVSLITSVSFAKTEVRIMWYGDGETEGKAMQDQLDKCPYVKGSIINQGCPDTIIKIITEDTVVKIISEIDTVIQLDTIVVITQKTFYDSISWFRWLK